MLREAGHDVVALRELHAERARDDEVLTIAAEQRRILLTHNAKDFELLHDAWRRWTRTWGVDAQHGGILIVPQRGEPVVTEVGGAVAALLSSTPSLVIELYRWRPAVGWVRRP